MTKEEGLSSKERAQLQLLIETPKREEDAKSPGEYIEALKWKSVLYISGMLGDFFREEKINRKPNPHKNPKATLEFIYWQKEREKKVEFQQNISLSDKPGLNRIIRIWNRADEICRRIYEVNNGEFFLSGDAEGIKSSLCRIVKRERNELIRSAIQTRIVHYLDQKEEMKK